MTMGDESSVGCRAKALKALYLCVPFCLGIISASASNAFDTVSVLGRNLDVDIIERTTAKRMATSCESSSGFSSIKERKKIKISKKINLRF